MTEAELRGIIAQNIAACRKLHGHTQADLAGRLNYSDKSVSKWERAEGMPDVYVLTKIAALYGLSIDDLLQKNAPIKKMPERILIALLSVCLVFLVAAVVYFSLRMIVPDLGKAFLCFVFALPVSCIVLTVFAAIWWSYRYQCAAVSGLIWSLALSVQLIVSREVLAIYVVAGIVQILCVLWYILQKHLHRTARSGRI